MSGIASVKCRESQAVGNGLLREDCASMGKGSVGKEYTRRGMGVCGEGIRIPWDGGLWEGNTHAVGQGAGGRE